MSRKNTKKTPAAATDPASPEALCEVRNAAEDKRFLDAVREEYPALSRVFKSLYIPTDSVKRSPFLLAVRLLQMRLSGFDSIYNQNRPKHIRAEIVDLLRCPYEFPCTVWRVENGVPVSAPNVRMVVAEAELQEVRDVLGSLLWQLGSLARKINSCECTRILRCIVAFRDRPGVRENCPQQEAERIADEFIYCYEAILAEITLLEPEERAELEYPRPPRRRSDAEYEPEWPKVFSAEECTARSREAALRRFRDENFSLLPQPLFDGRNLDVVKDAEESLHRLADDLEAKRPTLDRGADRFEYRTFGHILSADFLLHYRRFALEETTTEDGEKHSCPTSVAMAEETDQMRAKIRMIRDMKRYLSAAVALAAECGSETRGDWAEANVIFERRAGEFCPRNKMDEDAAAADLNAFLRLFRQARQRLWSDWERHCRADVHDKPVNTNPEGPAMAALRKDLGRVRDDTGHILYYDSDKKLGIGPADGRQKAPVRSDMVREAVEMIAGDSKHKKTLASIIATVGKRYANQKGCYDISNKDDRQSFTKAIRRECAEQGVDVPKVGTGKWK